MNKSLYRVVLGHLSNDILEYPLNSIEDVRRLSPQLVEAAQSVYDGWVVSEDGWDALNGGGICHLIVDKMLGVLGSIRNVYSVSSNYEQHVYIVGAFSEGIYSIDIPYGIYETGGGFSWKKIEGVVFEPSDLHFYCLSGDASEIRDYIDEY